VVCERSANSKLPVLDKIKYLVPNDLTAYQFNYIIRKRIKLSERDALFFFANDKYLIKGD
jgi:GABA(A) receptor-associated protein